MTVTVDQHRIGLTPGTRPGDLLTYELPRPPPRPPLAAPARDQVMITEDLSA